jgi:hypothetical protein
MRNTIVMHAAQTMTRDRYACHAPFAVAQVVEHRRRHHKAIVSYVNPASARVGLSPGQNWHRRMSRLKGFHLKPLAEPGLSLSPHPAFIRQACRQRLQVHKNCNPHIDAGHHDPGHAGAGRSATTLCASLPTRDTAVTTRGPITDSEASPSATRSLRGA